MAARRTAWRSGLAVVAAYLLVVQATLTGLTLGAHAAGPALFGDVICSSAAPSGASGQPATPSGPPNCCLPGCAMLGGGLGSPPALAFDALAAPGAIAAAPAAPAARLAVAAHRTPRSTRAPPIAG